MSDTETPKELFEAAKAFADEKIGKSWEIGKGSAWLPAMTTEHRFDQCCHAFIAGARWERKRIEEGGK
jgi:hypothetical protein